MNTMKWLLIFSFIGLSGCASFNRSLKAMLSGDSDGSDSGQTKANAPAKFSEQPNMIPGPKRQYRRMTKESLREESHVNERAGSLWTMEGQGAYLFSQNVLRMIGDPIGVKLEGEPREQLDTKVNVIRKLLSKLESRAQAQALQREPTEAKEKKPEEKPTTPNGKPEDKSDFNVATVPSRITERTSDGNYRVKGSQPFMIGPREYKVIVTGIVRSEDFSEDGISATKLLDPKFDIVSMRKREADL